MTKKGTQTTQLPRLTHSQAAHKRARAVMPGGVSSPVRAFKAVGMDPITIRQGKGPRITDIDGNDYIDYVLSYGPLILGHAFDPVVDAIHAAAKRGASFGMPSEGETQLAERVIKAVPSIDLVRFVNSGTEACMSAIRLARAATGKPKLIKCIGCYHGHSDGLLVQAGSGATTLGTPSSPGVPQSVTSQTILVPYNDHIAVQNAFAQHPDIAGIMIEPIAGNMGCIPPKPGYLKRLRELCDQHDALLIFDEVMTGFRVAYGGAQSLYDITPDLTCLGKVIGGGLPCAAYGGREDLMRQVAPDGPVYQAGTLSGNPLAMAAGIVMLEALAGKAGEQAYDHLEQAGAQLEQGLVAAAGQAGVPIAVSRVGSMIGCFFHDGEVTHYDQAIHCDTKAFATFFQSMLAGGVMLPPSQFEAWFLSTAHDQLCIDQTLEAAANAFEAVARQTT